MAHGEEPLRAKQLAGTPQPAIVCSYRRRHLLVPDTDTLVTRHTDMRARWIRASASAGVHACRVWQEANGWAGLESASGAPWCAHMSLPMSICMSTSMSVYMSIRMHLQVSRHMYTQTDCGRPSGASSYAVDYCLGLSGWIMNTSCETGR